MDCLKTVVRQENSGQMRILQGRRARWRGSGLASGTVRERRAVWQGRGLFVFFLPPYSPHLNIAEVLWRKLKNNYLKYEWLRPEDYADEETLRLAVWQALAAVGHSLRIEFSAFRVEQSSLT